MASSSLGGLTSGFFPSSNHDRLYTADQLGNLISALVNDGVIQSSGGDALPFAVAFNGSDNDRSSITIGKGIAWLNNTWTANTATGSLSVADENLVVIDSSHNRHVRTSPANASQNRWDAIAIEVNKTSGVRGNTFVIVEGFPGSNPSQPNSHDADSEAEGRYYHTIAYVYRPAGSGTTFNDMGADKLVYKIGQNGGTPWVMSVAGAAVPIDDILNYYRTAVDELIAVLNNKINEVGEKEISSNSVNTQHLVNGAVTTAKIHDGAVTEEKLGFSVIKPDTRDKVPAANASSALVAFSSNVTLTLSHAGCTMRNSNATAITVTLPSTLSWPAGTEMEFIRWGSGTFTISAGTTYTSFYTTEGSALKKINIANRYGTVILKLIAENSWLVVGDVE